MIDVDAFLDQLAAKVADKISDRLAGAALISPRLLEISQAAVYLARSKQAVQHLVSSGKLPTVRSDRRVFLDRLDLDTWIRENKHTPV